jgi:hypothetical protein
MTTDVKQKVTDVGWTSTTTVNNYDDTTTTVDNNMTAMMLNTSFVTMVCKREE